MKNKMCCNKPKNGFCMIGCYNNGFCSWKDECIHKIIVKDK